MSVISPHWIKELLLFIHNFKKNNGLQTSKVCSSQYYTFIVNIQLKLKLDLETSCKVMNGESWKYFKMQFLMTSECVKS